VLSSSITLALNALCLIALGALLYFQFREGAVIEVSPMDILGK